MKTRAKTTQIYLDKMSHSMRLSSMATSIVCTKNSIKLYMIMCLYQHCSYLFVQLTLLPKHIYISIASLSLSRGNATAFIGVSISPGLHHYLPVGSLPNISNFTKVWIKLDTVCTHLHNKENFMRDVTHINYPSNALPKHMKMNNTQKTPMTWFCLMMSVMASSSP